MSIHTVWLFHGADGRFAGGVFTDIALAEKWIFEHRLTGVLTEYPVNTGVFNWAIDTGLFTPKKEEHHSPAFIGKFTTAAQEHFHYENGVRG